MLLNVIWDIKLVLLRWPEKTTPSDQCTFWSGSWSTAVQKLWWIRNCLYVVLQRAPLVLLEWVTVCGFVFGGRVKAEKVWKWSLMFNYLVCLNFHGNNDWHFKAWEPLFYPRPWDKRYSWKTAAYLSTYPLKTICLIRSLPAKTGSTLIPQTLPFKSLGSARFFSRHLNLDSARTH